MSKSPEMKRALDRITSALFSGRTLTDAHESKECVSCGSSVLKWSNKPPVGPDWAFRDALSLQEYRISGLCQQCQDSVFEDPEQTDDLRASQ